MVKYAILLLTFGVIIQTVKSSEETELIETQCKTEDDCATFRSPFTNSTCIEGSCQCIQAENGTGVTCLPLHNKSSNQIGGQCPCNSENSYCNEKTQQCKCKNGFMPSRERKRCIVKSVPLNETCEIDEQCIMHDSFSHCDEAHRNCTCLQHFTDFQDTCHSVIEVSANGTLPMCELDADCANVTANTSCHGKKCICVRGFVANAERNSCLPVVKYEGNCTESNQCIAQLGVGSVCNEGQCMCSELFFPFPDHAHDNATGEDAVMTVCKRKITYGSTCNEDKECYLFHQGPHEQSMECFNGECVCKKSHIEKEGNCYLRGSSSTKNIPSIILAYAALVFTFCRK